MLGVSGLPMCCLTLSSFVYRWIPGGLSLFFLSFMILTIGGLVPLEAIGAIFRFQLQNGMDVSAELSSPLTFTVSGPTIPSGLRTVRLDELVSYERGQGLIKFCNGQWAWATLTSGQIQVKTPYGPLQVPAEHIVGIHMANLRHSLRQRVETVLAHCGFQDVHVASEGGTVVIAGSVRTEADKERVKRLVPLIPGVKAVVGDPTVQQPPVQPLPPDLIEVIQKGTLEQRRER